MPMCDLCGKEVEKLMRAEIEGTELNVCEGCRKFGIILGEAEKEKKIVLPKKKIVVEEEIEERVVPDFAEKIRKAREKRGMKQEEFAELLKEKESVVQKWEGGSLMPNIGVALKLEKILGIDLIEKIEEGKIELKGIKTGETTLGDVIRVRKKKE